LSRPLMGLAASEPLAVRSVDHGDRRPLRVLIRALGARL
jgi:hypothetical protein